MRFFFHINGRSLNYGTLLSSIRHSQSKAGAIGTIERGFTDVKMLGDIQWPSDRGSIHRAKDTIDLSRIFELTSSITAAYSPQSNGIVESFENTIKIYNSECVNADEVLNLLIR